MSHPSTQKARTILRAVPKARELLPLREYRILALRASGHTFAEIGDEHDITPHRVKDLERIAVERLHSVAKNTPAAFYFYERFTS